LFCFNAARNNPYLEHHHPQYTSLLKVSDDAVRAAGARMSAQGDAGFATKPTRPSELNKKL
jgi:hypothetical protein